MAVALTASIALLFTVGKAAMNKPENSAVATSAMPTVATSTTPTVATSTTPSILLEPCKCGCPAISPNFTRIVNGENAVPNSYPWQLLLAIFNGTGTPLSYCGASLISSQHVLTAAHCVFGKSPRYVFVFPGLHNFTNTVLNVNAGFQARIIYVHESYDDVTLNDDIALIRLVNPVEVNDRTISLACMIGPNDTPLQEDDEVVATGWGALSGSANRTRPLSLQQVKLRYVPQTNSLCSLLVGTRPGQMCAGFPPKGVCFGDSGGPLVRNIVHSNGQSFWQIVGVMSGTVDCGLATFFPDIFVNVRYYSEWIQDKIRQSS
ncbi:unnamed protein product [Didymodactylos carnosus]|uniref:Peptidase S1 domain-containing protein n=1 Tax=Didymodactylos carnosus TaxID=1234261 RepID=A0A814RUG3_9BILA|nr:unnamed protein product [Didymodactylos carnosus]CAF3902411.1 unnamed protein product [Didymodactylos carnosus]